MRAQHGILTDAPAEHATRRQHAQRAPVPEPGPGPALLPPGTGIQGGDRHQDHGLQAFPTIPSSAFQARQDWFLLDSSAPNSPTPFLQPIDPFLTHSGTNIVDFGLGIPVGDFTTHVGTSITPLPPLSGTSSNFDFDFDFNSPTWEPPIGDGMTLSPGIGPMPYSGAGMPGSTEAYSTTADPSRTTITSRQRHRNPSWLDDYDLMSHRDLHSPQSSRGTTTTGRRRQKKGKARDDSTTASGSVRSASITSTHLDAYPFPDPASNPPNPLIPSSGSDRRRSTRTTTRAKSVATTASASSSSTAPTPSSVSATSAAGGPSTAPPPTASTAATPRSAGSAAANQSRLRSASRASKNSVNRPSDTPEERRTRASHNLVEKQYRSRLNAQFEGLLGALPDLTTGRGAGESKEGEAMETASPKGGGDAGEAVAVEGDQNEQRKVSKAEVLERARLHIEMLERESEALRREREELLANLLRAEGEVVSSGGEGLEEFLRRSGKGRYEELGLKEEGGEEYDEEEEDKEVKRE